MSEWKIKDKFGLPENWEIFRLHDLTAQIVDGTHFTPKYKENGVPFLRVTDIQTKNIEFTNLKFISYEEHEQLKLRCAPKKGDILVSKNGSIGIIKIVDWEWEFSIFVSLALIKTKQEIFNLYLKYLLQSEITWWQIKLRAKQGTVTNLHLEEIRELEIPKPSLTEQRQIARILSTCDEVIEKTQQAIAKYKAIKQGMLHDLFTRGIDPASGGTKLRPRYEDAPELYKQSKLGWIPIEWEEKEFDDACDFITDGSHFSPTPIEEGEIIVNVKDMGEFGINYETCTRINYNEFTLLKSQNCSPRIGDILLSKDGTIGRVVLFKDDSEIVLLSSIAILRPSAKIIPEYLYSFLKSEYFDKQLLIKTSGSALKRIVLRDINTLFLVYPESNDEQEMISKRIIQIESKLQSEQTYLQKLQAIKQGLMSDLLSGRKRVKNIKL